jgi:hypothetical protein
MPELTVRAQMRNVTVIGRIRRALGECFSFLSGMEPGAFCSITSFTVFGHLVHAANSSSEL